MLFLDKNWFLDLSQSPLGDWTEQAPLTKVRHGMGIATDVNERYIYLIGGEGQTPKYRDIDKYDSETNSWSRISAQLSHQSQTFSTKGANTDVWLWLSECRCINRFDTSSESVEAAQINGIPSCEY